MRAIILASIEGVAVLIPNVKQIIQAARIDRIGVWVGKPRLHSFDKFRRDRHGPVRALIESWKARIEALLQEPSGLLRCLVERRFGFPVGIEGLAFLDSDRFELINQRPIARNPGLVLYDAVEILEEARVV